jgi:L-threonylcarbamoyladenylate synthase
MIRKDNEATRSDAAAVIAAGGIVAFRTDTFYGLGADPFNSRAIQKIRELKGRQETKPILLLIADESQVDRFIQQSEFFKLVARKHWPAPLTLIGVSRPEVPAELTAGTNSLGVRLPDNEEVRAFVRVCGGSLTATSANVSGEPPARTAREVETYFPSGIDLIVDGGEVTVTDASTVLDVSSSDVRLVREGALPRSKLNYLF